MTDPAIHPQSIDQAAKILTAGGICAFATETVYGLGANATNSDAVLSVYQAKGRPRFNPLIVHCSDFTMAEKLVVFSPLARDLAEKLWPGPLTLVLPMRPEAGISDIVTAGLDTLAVRVPAHDAARELVATLNRPIAAPSANPSGRLSATCAEQVKHMFANSVPVLDGGRCAAGVESTIIAVVDDELVQLRAGAMTREEISATVGKPVLATREGVKIAAPGMLKSHYAPNANLRLNATAPRAGEAFLAFGRSPDFTGPMRNLSATADLREAARNLFASLHVLDAENPECIAVAPIPKTGLGEAINDRLQRAAAPTTI